MPGSPVEVVRTFADVLRFAGERPPADATQQAKKNYAERVSRLTATMLANVLRPKFKGILPDEQGKFQESRALGVGGPKKLDVNYSTPELGLGLGISVKSVHFPDQKTRRYTKNYTRNDNELRAEASDYHERQPYAVMIAVVLLPLESCDDCRRGEEGESSFAAAAKIFRRRAGRDSPRGPNDKFERLLIGLYDAATAGIRFFDVLEEFPRATRPDENSGIDLEELAQLIEAEFELRNR